MSKVAAKTHFYYKELFRLYKIQRFFVIGLGIGIIATTLIPGIETQNPNANITTMSDSVWWVVSTMTNTGYGDYYPITTLGRIVGMILMITGIVIFSTTVGLVASVYAHRRTLRDSNRLHAELEEIASQVEEINKKVEYLVKEKIKTKPLR